MCTFKYSICKKKALKRLSSTSDPFRSVHTWFVIMRINSGETGWFRGGFWSSSVKGKSMMEYSSELLLLLFEEWPVTTKVTAKEGE